MKVKNSNDLYNKYKNKGERKMQIADAILNKYNYKNMDKTQ